MQTEVYMLDKSQLEHYRDRIDAVLDSDPSLWNRRFTDKEELWHNVYCDYVQMWAVCDADCIHCVFMTEVMSHPRRVLRIFWAWGENLVAEFPMVDLVVDRFAGLVDCEEIQIEGRRGWEKVIKANGGEFMYATYRRPVRFVKGH